MPNKIWSSTSSTSYGTAGNWNPTAIPIDGDDVQFFATNAVSATTNCNQTGVALNSLVVNEGCPSSIGAAGAGAGLICTASRFEHRGTGSVYFAPDVQAGMVILDSPNRTNAFFLGGTASERVHVKRGKMQVEASITSDISSLEVSYRSAPGSDAIVDVQTTTQAITEMILNGGSTTTNCDIGTVVVGPGATWICSAGVPSLVYNMGGTIFMNSPDISEVSPSLTLFVLCAGTLDLMQNPHYVTINLLKKFQGATIKYDAQKVTIVAGGSGAIDEIPIF